MVSYDEYKMIIKLFVTNHSVFYIYWELLYLNDAKCTVCHTNSKSSIHHNFIILLSKVYFNQMDSEPIINISSRWGILIPPVDIKNIIKKLHCYDVLLLSQKRWHSSFALNTTILYMFNQVYYTKVGKNLHAQLNRLDRLMLRANIG